MTLYVVACYTAQFYHDAYFGLEGVFSTKEKAEEAVRQKQEFFKKACGDCTKCEYTLKIKEVTLDKIDLIRIY